MRVAYVISQFPAISHTFIRREIEALRKRDVSVTVTSIKRSGAPFKDVFQVQALNLLAVSWAILREVFWHPIGFLRAWMLALAHRPSGLNGLIWAHFHLLEACVVANHLRGQKIQHIHCHFANSGATITLLAAALMKVTWSLTLHGISETDPPAGQLLGEKIGSARFVACASWFMRAQAMRMVSPDCWAKLTVVRCGIDLDALPSSPPLDGDTIQFLAVGRISAEKAFTGLVETFGKLAKQFPNIALTIVGDGPDRKELESAIAQCARPSAIELTGALPESETLERIAGCHALILPSLMEGLPVVIIEALAQSKPVIASQVAGIPELVVHGRTGLLFTVGNWELLRTAIETLLLAEDKGRTMGENGREAIEREYTVAATSEKMYSLFDQAINGASPVR